MQARRDQTPVDERRRGPRADCFKWVLLLPHSPRGDWKFAETWIVDCSPHGVGLLTDRPLEPGEQVLLRLRADTTLLVRYAVRHCQRDETPGRFCVGAEFQSFLRCGQLLDASELFQTLLAAER